MKARLNAPDYVAITFATVLLVMAPMMNAALTFVLALAGLIAFAIFARPRVRQPGIQGAILGFIVALLAVVSLRLLHH